MGSAIRLLLIAFFCCLVTGCGGGGAASGGAVNGGAGSVPTTFVPGKTGVALDISVKRTPAREGEVRLATAADVQEVLIDFLDPTTLQPAVNTTIVKRSGAAVDIVIDVPVGTWILRIQGRTASGDVAGSRFETTITVLEGQTTEAAAELNPATNLTRVDVTPGPTTQLVVGTSSQFTATGLLSDLTTVALTGVAQWSSSNPAVATVTTTGLVVATGPGTAVITARSGAVQGSSTVTVTAVAVRELQVTPSNATLTEGLTQQLTATAVLADNTNQNVTDQATWTSSAPNVATVTNTGLVTAGSPGNATVRASFGGREASAVISVNPTLVRLELSPTNLTLPVGTSQSLRATGVFSNNSTQDLSNTVTWTSANPATATVSSSGEVTGVAAGTTNVTATADNVTATASVRVEPLQLTRLSLTPSSATVPKGATQAFNATGTFSNNSTRDVTDEVTWTSTNSSVLVISNANGTRGVATAVNAGGTVVEATLDGISAAASVNVTPATLVSLTLSPANPETGSGNLVVFTARGTFSDGTNVDLTTNVTWTSGNVNVATISNAAGSEGNAVSIAGGTTTITAAFGNVTASTSFTTTVPVPPPPVPTPTPALLPNVLVNYNASNTDASTGPCDNRGKKSLNSDGTLVVFVGDYFNNLVVPGGGDQGIYVRNTTTNTTQRVTPDPGAGPGGGAGDFGSPGLSSDGRYVVFECRAPLVPEDTNGSVDVYLVDRNDPLLTPRLVSVNPATGLAAGSTQEASLSDDGRYVVFTCPVPLTADANPIHSVYRRDMTKANNDPAAIELINRRSDGSAGNSARSCQPNPQISSDGRYVIFSSNDDTLAGSPSAFFRIYRRDTLGGPGSTVLVSQDAAVGDALLPGTNASGSLIAYQYQEAQREIYVRDMATALPALVSFTHDGLTANGDNIDPTVSADGRFVTWSSTATNLVPGVRPPGPKPDVGVLAVGDPQNIFVRDRAGAQSAVALLTPRFAGSLGNCSGARLSPNGRGVAFTSTAGDLIAGLTFVGQNVYRFANTLSP